ncbi:MAG: hypothetical protein OEX22_13085 [Cyclobacteriaceae bacterium]|nr:hypothetical protein [Cyclobacteriaceae bacterium]
MYFLKYSLSFLFFLCVSLVEAQQNEDYYVIRVTGKITNISAGKALEVRDKFNAKDEIKFSSTNDYAVVISSVQGHLVLKPHKAEKKEGELTYFVRENLIPMQKHTSTRGQFTEFFKQSDIKHYFESRPFLLLEQNQFWMFNGMFEINDSSYLYMATCDDNKAKLSYNSKTQLLTINRKKALTLSNTDCPTYKLFYYDAGWQQSFEICTIDFVTLSNDELKEEITLIKEYSSASSDKELMADIHSYVRFTYGNFDEEALGQIINN